MRYSGWFTTECPLFDGWYLWRCNDADPYPECIEIINGAIMDNIPNDSYGTTWVIYEHTDYSGEWWGPIEVPE